MSGNAPTPRNPQAQQVRRIGRYAMFELRPIAAGGMASVHFGRLVGSVGFARTVAIKRLHPQFARDPDFVAMFLDEARLVSRIRHPNVVQTLDVVPLDGELFIVMDYVHGEPLSRLVRATSALGTRIPVKIAASTIANALHGLHAAHETRDPHGQPLGIVHRDVSPHNIIVGTDGVARVIDFGIAYAAGRRNTTDEGQLKGKLAYMSPEQLSGEGVDRLTDVYAASVVLWELLTGRRLFDADNQGQLIDRVLRSPISPPSTFAEHIPPAVEDVVMRGLARDPRERWPSAREMAVALERAAGMATPSMVGGWVESVSDVSLAERAEQLAALEQCVFPDEEEERTSTVVGLRGARASMVTPAPAFPVGRSSSPAPPRATGRVAIVLAVASSCALGVGLGAFAYSGGKSQAGSQPIFAPERPVERQEQAAATGPDAAAASSTPGVRFALPALNPANVPAPRPTPRPVASAVSHPVSDACTPPFTFDASGHKKYKIECL